MVIGGTVRDAGCGESCEDPSGGFPGAEDDQADLPGVFFGSCAPGIYDNMKTAVDTIFVGRDRACNRVRLFPRTTGVHRLTPADVRALSGRAAVPWA
ncbi:hypothetical protein DVR11_20835 [Paracoccus versutus]|nr:hypothetical protein DVR11_20835 [Paracoccus versutus]